MHALRAVGGYKTRILVSNINPVWLHLCPWCFWNSICRKARILSQLFLSESRQLDIRLDKGRPLWLSKKFSVFPQQLHQLWYIWVFFFWIYALGECNHLHRFARILSESVDAFRHQPSEIGWRKKRSLLKIEYRTITMALISIRNSFTVRFANFISIKQSKCNLQNILLSLNQTVFTFSPDSCSVGM